MINRLKIEKDKEKCLKAAKEALNSKRLIIYPTDTVYGLGADATSDKAVKKVYEAKSRPSNRPISVAVDSLSMAEKVGNISKYERRVMKDRLPGPLTLILESNSYVSNFLTGKTGKIGVRIPKHPLVLELIERFNKPITTTSANITGQKNPITPEEAIDQLNNSVELALDDGKLKKGEPSTVAKLDDSDVQIMRQGPISKQDIQSSINRSE